MTSRADEFVQHVTVNAQRQGFRVEVMRSLNRDATGLLIMDGEHIHAKIVVSGRDLLTSRNIEELARIKVEEAMNIGGSPQPRAIDVD